MQTYRDVVANRQGVPVPGASILVKTAAGALASLFDTNGASIANPITSVDGSFAFAAANGDYVLNIASFGGVVVVDGIQLYDPADDSLADYTALRAYVGTSTSVYVTGYLVTAAPSGIAGIFVRDDSDTTSADNGGTVIVASNGKRWKRAEAGVVSAKVFGAVGDNVSDDTTKLQALFDKAPTIQNGSIYEARVRIPAGVYKLTDSIKLPTSDSRNVRWVIDGDGPLQTKLYQTTLGKPIFDVQEAVGSAGNQSVIKNIGMSGPEGTGQSYVSATSACILGRFALGWRIFNCWFTSMYCGIHMTEPVGTPNIGGEDYYINWNVFEFIQNPICIDGVTTTVSVSSRSASGNVATLVTATAHGLVAGQKIGVRGMGNPAYNQSNIQVLAVPTSTSFTYRVGALSSEGSTADTGGTVYWLNGRSVHISFNEFASVARTDIGGLGSDAAINLNAVESVQLVGNKYAYGVGKGLIATNCRDMLISGEDFSMSNESINASIGAFGQENMTFDNSIDVQIGPCLYSNNISGANVQLKNGSKVAISGGTFSNVAGAAAVKASGSGNELLLTGATFDNVMYAVVEVDSKTALVNSRISVNKVGKLAASAKLVNVISGVLDASVVVENNSPDTAWCAIEGKWKRSFPVNFPGSGTKSMATVNLIDYGAAVVTLRINGLSQGAGSVGYERRYSLQRTTGTTTITALAAGTAYGSASSDAQMQAVTSGNQTEIQAVIASASGFAGTVEIEISGNLSNTALLY